MKAIQERAAQAKSETEAAATEAAKTVEVQAEAVKSEVQEAAPKVEKVVKEAPKEVAAQVESVATEAKKAPEFLQREVETVVSEVKKAPEALEGPTAQAPEKPVDSVAVEVQKAAESVTAKVEKAAEAVGSKVEAVVGQTGGKESAGASEAQLPLTGPNSAKRLKEAQVRTPSECMALQRVIDVYTEGKDPVQGSELGLFPEHWQVLWVDFHCACRQAHYSSKCHYGHPLAALPYSQIFVIAEGNEDTLLFLSSSSLASSILGDTRHVPQGRFQTTKWRPIS